MSRNQRSAQNLRMMVASALFMASAGTATAQFCPNGVCPPVTVTAPRVGGGTVVCYGSDCADMLRGMQEFSHFQAEVLAIPVDSPGAVDKSEFCNELKNKNPNGNSCPAGGPTVPRVPGYGISRDQYANTMANGCGDGSAAFVAANLMARVTVTGYTGDPNQPYPGLHLQDICNAHDACYAAQAGRGACDGAFDSALETRVNDLYTRGQDPHRNALNVARAYAAAVGLKGTSAYEKASADYRCAAWNASMDANQCPR